MSNQIPVPESSPAILIAEDSPTQALQLQHILEQHGYRVIVTTNGRQALEAAGRERPALVISDVVMPEMTGFELCSRLKSDARLRDVPVVLVTTLSDPQEVIRSLECRADNFVLKPYDADQLLRRIEWLLANPHPGQGKPADKDLEIAFGGQLHRISADRQQILNLLLSTYEAAISRNQDLSAARDTLRHTNVELQQLTAQLEDRVLTRTRELERSNEALRQAQRAMIQQERLRALGQMASGIAHDINNAISPIALYTESLLERETTLSSSVRDRLVTIQRAIDDVARTVARMREFYRPQEATLQLSQLDLNTLVLQVIDFTRIRWSDQPQSRGVMIELKAELAPDLPPIRGADHEIRDAITNLIFNAADATSKGGTITLRTSSLELPAANGTFSHCVQLEVADSGAGMDEETRRRCLEPFFTTKGERGSGLGLAMVYGMAQRHGANLDIDSELGSGTTIRLRFPTTEVGTEPTTRLRTMQLPIRELCILVVDDDPVLRESLQVTLQQDGHSVTVAEGGQAGIDVFHASQKDLKPFDVVITDLGMPYVDGRQVAQAVRSAAPSIPIVLLTGWGDRLQAEGDTVPEVNRVLGKPPHMRELRAALVELTMTAEADKAP